MPDDDPPAALPQPNKHPIATTHTLLVGSYTAASFPTLVIKAAAMDQLLFFLFF